MRHSGQMCRSTAVTTTAWVAGAALATAGVTVALSVLVNACWGRAGPGVAASAALRAHLAAPRGLPARPRHAAAGALPVRLVRPVGGPDLQRRHHLRGLRAAPPATLTDWIPAQGYRTAGFSPVVRPYRSGSSRRRRCSVLTATCPAAARSSSRRGLAATPSATRASPAGHRRSPPPPPGPGRQGQGQRRPGRQPGGHGGDG